MTKPLLVAAGAYLAAIGLALIVVPKQFGVGAVPDDASPELIALLRLLGGPFLGISVLNWMSRKAEPAAIRNTVILANLVGFAAVTANDVVGVATGHARAVAAVFLLVHAAFALLFAIAWLRGRSRPGSPAGQLRR